MGIHFGVDYYPEHWPRERWETDAKLMQEMGVQVVRMAEFSWFKMEPSEGEFHFEWLEEAVALLDRYGIKTVLGTPTAAPPAWIIEKNPEIQPIDRQGRRRHFGGRHHDCQSNEVYRAHIKRFVTAMSQKFADNPGVIGWQIDNELGNSHGDLCMCDSCKAKFQKWLEQKYGTIETLNDAWGTAFWSQGYNSFAQIGTPLITAVGENPSAMLDWKCFCSDLVVDFAKWQADIIRENCPNHFITHNYMCFDNKVDYYDLGELLDFVSNDIYPAGHWQKQPHQPESELAASHDVIRGYKKKPFWMMEQQSGMAGWEIMGRALEPGQMASWAMQSVAHGADAVVFFRWRTCAMGTEQYWHGILGHSGNPGRTYREAKQLVHTFAKHMDAFEGTMPNPEVAIVHSFRQNYALDIQPNHPELSYVGQLQKYYKALYEKKIPVDFVQGMDDLSKYKLVIAPLQYLMTPQLEQHYIDYVANGGHLVLTMRTGVKDATNLCMTDRELPGRLGDICGIEVPEYDCLLETLGGVLYGKKEYEIEKWCDIIELKGARQIAEYSTGFYKQSPAITENAYGNGITWYVGTEPGEDLMEDLMAYMIRSSDVETLGAAADGVEMMTRESDDQIWLFVINHTSDEQVYHLHDRYTLLEGEKEEFLRPYEVQLFVKNKGKKA
ncbi:MAG: beta-galactosidase [Lachnospiraceae bacterium]|nr:beta-galactosidase [Lachnospiraceae bacterium]